MEKNGVLFAHVPELLVFVCGIGRGGKDQYSFCCRNQLVSCRVSDPDPYPDPDPHGSALI